MWQHGMVKIHHLNESGNQKMLPILGYADEIVLFGNNASSLLLMAGNKYAEIGLKWILLNHALQIWNKANYS